MLYCLFQLVHLNIGMGGCLWDCYLFQCLYPNAMANFGAFTFNSGEVYPEPRSIVQDFFKNGCDLNSIFEPELHDGVYCYGAICVQHGVQGGWSKDSGAYLRC